VISWREKLHGTIVRCRNFAVIMQGNAVLLPLDPNSSFRRWNVDFIIEILIQSASYLNIA